ncbi:MAG: hypothetical protein MJZ24_03815 [Paludibacteraceae bacterium]|nr:hypothetical protein [Paludibacteraceae bacterium]
MAEIKCPSCGSPNIEQIDTDKYQCPYCGNTFSCRDTHAFQQPQQTQGLEQKTIEDAPNCLMNGLCFFIPLVGIILYFIKKNEQPNCAKKYLTWSLIGIGLGVIINIIVAIASFDFSSFYSKDDGGTYSAISNEPNQSFPIVDTFSEPAEIRENNSSHLSSIEMKDDADLCEFEYDSNGNMKGIYSEEAGHGLELRTTDFHGKNQLLIDNNDIIEDDNTKTIITIKNGRVISAENVASIPSWVSPVYYNWNNEGDLASIAHGNSDEKVVNVEYDKTKQNSLNVDFTLFIMSRHLMSTAFPIVLFDGNVSKPSKHLPKKLQLMIWRQCMEDKPFTNYNGNSILRIVLLLFMSKKNL